MYHKIRTLWARENTKPHKIIVGVYDNPEFELLKDIEWVATEKVDGTNIRIMWDGYKVSFGGRTDRAQLPVPLYDKLQELFGGEANEQIFESTFGSTPVCLYGEGFGGRIQSGGNYGETDFVLFDVKIGDWWLQRPSMVEVALKLDIGVVPIVYHGNLMGISDFVSQGFKSAWGDFICEGIVAKPAEELFNRKGERIITKLKYRDFL